MSICLFGGSIPVVKYGFERTVKLTNQIVCFYLAIMVAITLGNLLHRTAGPEIFSIEHN